MDGTTHEPLNLDGEELATVAELLEEARTKLLVEIRRTDHRRHRDELLSVVRTRSGLCINGWYVTGRYNGLGKFLRNNVMRSADVVDSAR